MVEVTQADREFRAAILKHIIDTLDRPCSEGDMPDDRNDAFDLFLANHRRAATSTLTTENAALAARVEALEGALRTITKCESRFPGNVVDVARAALAGDPS